MLVLSSDSDNSNDETERRIEQIPNLIRFRSSEQKHKYVRLLNDNDKVEDFESDTFSSCSYNSDQLKIMFYDDDKIHEEDEEIFDMIDEYSNVFTGNNDNQEPYINNKQQLCMNNEGESHIMPQNNYCYQQNCHIESRTTMPCNDTKTINDSSIKFVQTSVYKYFPILSRANQFEIINNFRIRCKTIYKSSIRYVGTYEKVFDAIVCDSSGETKVVAFNDDVDKFFNMMTMKETITIENGNIRIARKQFRSPHSIYEIRLLSTSKIKSYKCVSFNPIMLTKTQSIENLLYLVHGSSIDIEGAIIIDSGLSTRVCEFTGTIFRTRRLQIKDETGIANIIIWNDKIEEIPDSIVNKNIRIRNAKLNHLKSNN
ncbi:unnamed protein product [Rotaria magnacalcarata]|uniref:Replication protein A1 n=1 Tax=Rotaria magnacalcarata TaxID=392030 RepID=A0A816GUD8_9BILA|nr:unnamed protein product [Rotaria magnacalcarata]CAF2090692.1 unnamed protein product [Rotaria magnacalcarata]